MEGSTIMTVLLRLQLAIRSYLTLLRARPVRPAPTRVVAREGQAFLEYALVLAVVAVIVLVAAQALGTDLSAVFDRIRTRLGTLG